MENKDKVGGTLGHRRLYGPVMGQDWGRAHSGKKKKKKSISDGATHSAEKVQIMGGGEPGIGGGWGKLE